MSIVLQYLLRKENNIFYSLIIVNKSPLVNYEYSIYKYCSAIYRINVNGRKIRHSDNYARDYFTDLVANDTLQFVKNSRTFFPDKLVTDYTCLRGKQSIQS